MEEMRVAAEFNACWSHMPGGRKDLAGQAGEKRQQSS